jgi:hypothetical protein
MAVERFQSFEDARRARWWPSDHPALARRIRSWWILSRVLDRREHPRGVSRFRSIEAAQRARGAGGAALPPRD